MTALFIYLFVCLFVYLFIYLFTYLFIYLFILYLSSDANITSKYLQEELKLKSNFVHSKPLLNGLNLRPKTKTDKKMNKNKP